MSTRETSGAIYIYNGRGAEPNCVEAIINACNIELAPHVYDLKTFNDKSQSADVAGHVTLLSAKEQSWGLIDSALYLMTARKGRSAALTDDVKKFVDWYGYKNLQKFNAGAADEFSASHAFEIGKLAMMIDGDLHEDLTGPDVGDGQFLEAERFAETVNHRGFHRSHGCSSS